MLLTEKPNCPKELQKNCDEIVFEQFEFAAYYRCVGTLMVVQGRLQGADICRTDNGCICPHGRRVAGYAAT